MTDEEIRTKIAEKMGRWWTVEYRDGSPRWWVYSETKPNRDYAAVCHQPRFEELDDDRVNSSELPHWSTDLNAAFTLANQLHAHGGQVVIGRMGKDGPWRCTNGCAGDGGVCGESDTPARAICLAWLAAQEKK